MTRSMKTPLTLPAWAALTITTLLNLPATATATSSRSLQFHNAGHDNLLFLDHVLFDVTQPTPVRSLLDCAVQCGGHSYCMAFTYGRGGSGICRGYSNDLTSYVMSTPSDRVKTYRMEGWTDRTGPCADGSHTVWDDVRRDVNNAVTSSQSDYLCDSDSYLVAGWYRLLLNGQNAVIPNTCVLFYHCGTQGTLWLGVNGTADGMTLPSAGQQKQGDACMSSICDASTSCVTTDNKITVRNCGSFFVYFLQGQRPCSQFRTAYCAEISS